jgi:glyoxylate carboligase
MNRAQSTRRGYAGLPKGVVLPHQDDNQSDYRVRVSNELASLVCITGRYQPDTNRAFQETDVIGISMPVTKWNYLITKAEEIPSILAQAFYIARTGRPGPVLIDIAKNAQFGMLDFDHKCPCAV